MANNRNSNQHKLANTLDRIRRESDALLVLIIQPDWGYISTDPKLTPKDPIETMRNEISNIEAYLSRKHTEARR
jgi:hypothetical protein